MIQFLAILTDVIRIATFQRRGEATRGHCRHHHPDVSTHHSSWTDRHRIRRSMP